MYRGHFAPAAANTLSTDPRAYGWRRRRGYVRRFLPSATRQEFGHDTQQRWGEVRSKCAF
jgi:hypothetical protein